MREHISGSDIISGKKNIYMGDGFIGGMKDISTFEEAISAVYGTAAAVMVSKQKDYGAGNIEQAGEYGVALRANDKIQRLLNILKSDGNTLLRIREVVQSIQDDENASELANAFDRIAAIVESNGDVQNEPITDSWIDMLNYGAIGYMLNKGIWGLPLSEDK